METTQNEFIEIPVYDEKGNLVEVRREKAPLPIQKEEETTPPPSKPKPPKPKEEKHNWWDVVFKWLHQGTYFLSASEKVALDKYYAERIKQMVWWRREVQALVLVDPIERWKHFIEDLQSAMHVWLFDNKQKLKKLPKMELWKKFDNRAGYYLYEKYMGESIRDGNKGVCWADQNRRGMECSQSVEDTEKFIDEKLREYKREQRKRKKEGENH